MPVHEQATQYIVTALPLDDIDADVWSVRVEWRGADRWAVTGSRFCYSRAGAGQEPPRPTYEPIPSEREDEWLARHRFTLDEAMDLARYIAPRMVINGMTADQVIEFKAQRQAVARD